ncbi:MAG: hypothetical protein DCF31_15555 [Alphaproteobacteria bacterium]|nr:MAG: hypothetical protein DCF31_15555 [Alphaproteobacteria bacterium]
MTASPPIWASQDAGTLPWLAVAGYLVGAALCLWRRGGADAGRERLFWLVAALLLLGLGLNKQLDLQTMLTDWGRRAAREGGWYAQRRALQLAFVAAAAVAVLLVGAGLAGLVRGLRLRVRVVLAGLALLGAFVLVRVASFHHIDVAMRTPVLGLKLYTVLELAGIAIVIAGAAWPRAARAAQRHGVR